MQEKKFETSKKREKLSGKRKCRQNERILKPQF